MRPLRFALLALLGMFFLAEPALAQKDEGITTNSIESNWNKLTEQQKAALATQIARQSGENDDALDFKGPVVSAEDVAPWFSLIDTMGEALVRLARDLGVTANELLRTPIGTITMGLIAYHVMGNEIMGILVGLLWFALTMPVWLLLFYKLVVPVVKYETVKQERWYRDDPIEVQVPVRRRVTFSANEPDGCGPEWVSTISLVLIFVVTLICIA